MRLYGMRYFYQLLMKKRYFKMKFLYSLSLILFVSVNLFSEPIYNFQNAEDEIRFNTLVKEIRCPKCTSGSLASSNAPISQDLKLKIVEMINENKSDEEIKDYVSTRFGVDSLYEPALTEDTYFLWFAPFILLLITLLVFFLRKTE
jgi:cytochrome c-type biogenesis protein CcmH